ncbi:MAG TPA: NifU family protein [Candidatus Hypogeohydataceae bacterium YC41]
MPKLDTEKVKQVLSEIRPALQADGGDIELVGVNGGVVKVRLKGACGSCPSALITLKMGVEARLKEELPELEYVEAV